MIDALFCLAQQQEAITEQIELRVTTLLLQIIASTGGEVARRVNVGGRDANLVRIRRLRHQVTELLCMHALYTKDSDVQLLWIGQGLETCYEMLFDAMSLFAFFSVFLPLQAGGRGKRFGGCGNC